MLAAHVASERPRRHPLPADRALGHAGATHLTFFRFGLRFFAAGEALRVAEARIAPARFWLIPCRFAICDWAALNPIPFLLFAISPSSSSAVPGTARTT